MCANEGADIQSCSNAFPLIKPVSDSLQNVYLIECLSPPHDVENVVITIDALECDFAAFVMERCSRINLLRKFLQVTSGQ